MTTPIKTVQGFYAALGRGDVPGVLAHLAPALSWTEAERFPYYSGTWTTPHQVLENLLIPASRDWQDFSATASRYIDAGDTVVALGDYGGVHHATGRRLAAPFAHVWTVQDGLITGFIQYTDTALVREAAGA